jgi:hypothetical protein
VRKAALLLLLTVALAGCGGSDDEAQAPARSSVTELDNVLSLRSDFEAASGKTRLLVLFSPT